MKTSELTGAALDWAVAKCEGEDSDYVLASDQFFLLHNENSSGLYCYSSDWSQGGPIIEQEMLTVGPAKHQGYMAWAWPKNQGYWGDTPLIAAMRCYVASKLGDEVDVPEELLEQA